MNSDEPADVPPGDLPHLDLSGLEQTLSSSLKSIDAPVARLTAATTLWFKHQALMGTRSDAADVVEALAKIHANCDELRGR